ncbi:MAG: 30S ribosomal protein S4 [Thermodesulfobacteriota bacterium]|nr:30S ribosomal protein S4 [Thermodesulfobacteriota bacterium]
MGRYRESVCRLCRRENLKLFLKGDRCYTDKCAFDRRGYPPGEHGQMRPKFSGYGVQLREKQKVKRMYGLSEHQFRRIFFKADRQKGITGTNLLIMLERRFDNTLYRLGFVGSRTQGRIMIRHNHFLVNGRKVNIPSYMLKPGDVIEIREKSKNVQTIADALASVERRGVPQWLSLEKDNLKGVVQNLPAREDITIPIQEQLIVELYSK